MAPTTENHTHGEADCEPSMRNRTTLRLRYATKKRDGTLECITLDNLAVTVLCAHCFTEEARVDQLMTTIAHHWKMVAKDVLAPEIARVNNHFILYNPRQMATVHTNAEGTTARYTMLQDDQEALDGIDSFGSVTVINNPSA